MHAESDSVDWCQEPNKSRGLFYHYWNARIDKPVTAVLLHPFVMGAYIHFDGTRDRPCRRHTGKCDGCDALRRRGQKGYVGGWNPDVGRVGIVVLTKEAWANCPILTDKSKSLRGVVLRTYRAGKTPNSRMKAERLGVFDRPSMIPEPFNLQEALLRLWFSDTLPKTPSDDVPLPDPPETPQALNTAEIYLPKGVQNG